MLPRVLQAELLDSLPADHPAAHHNRRDLRLTNALMGNHRWLVRTLARRVAGYDRVLELGAGTGELGRRLARRGVPVDGLDLWPRPDTWPNPLRWHQADLRNFSGWPDYPVVIGNLIFHQFTDAELAALGRTIRTHAHLIVACEPQRRRIYQHLYRWLGPLFGANYVSLHDAHVSIAAGFCRVELPRLLGLGAANWDCTCTTTVLGAYRMVAVRRP